MARIGRTLALIGLVSLCGLDAAFAQERGIGAKGGVNLATQSTTGGDESAPLDTRVAAVAGAFYLFPLGSRLAVQAEALYTSKGARLRILGTRSTLVLDYLEAPVLARFRIAGSRRRIYAAGGLAPAWRLRANARTTFSGSSEEIDVADQVERLDLGAVMGGGVTAGRVTADARYTLGVRNIDKNASGSDRTINRTISITAGYRF